MDVILIVSSLLNAIIALENSLGKSRLLPASTAPHDADRCCYFQGNSRCWFLVMLPWTSDHLGFSFVFDSHLSSCSI